MSLISKFRKKVQKTAKPDTADELNPKSRSLSHSVTYSALSTAFSFFETRNLVGIRPDNFKQFIIDKIGIHDPEFEGYNEGELAQQRDLSIVFCWGHNHNFGEFQIEGRMQNRHLDLLANFIEIFPIEICDFKSKCVFDVGCWTGGTTLLLCALGARVHAIEEVKKYADMTSFLAQSFGLKDSISVSSDSLYSCNRDDFRDRFDIVYFPGVIYHLSDPVLGLRILYNSLKLGGTILVESAGTNKSEAVCIFEGSRIYHTGSKELMNRGGWNWFLPSPRALERMLLEAGFDEVQAIWFEGRVYAIGKKLNIVGICKAGLSVTDIP